MQPFNPGRVENQRKMLPSIRKKCGGQETPPSYPLPPSRSAIHKLFRPQTKSASVVRNPSEISLNHPAEHVTVIMNVTDRKHTGTSFCSSRPRTRRISFSSSSDSDDDATPAQQEIPQKNISWAQQTRAAPKADFKALFEEAERQSEPIQTHQPDPQLPMPSCCDRPTPRRTYHDHDARPSFAFRTARQPGTSWIQSEPRNRAPARATRNGGDVKTPTTGRSNRNETRRDQPTRQPR
jgi:hypothetical protein